MMEKIVDLIGIQNVDDTMVIIVLMTMASVYLFCCEVYFWENQLMGSDQTVVVSRQGVGFCGLLFIVLLSLKLGVANTTVVGWSWIWIFSPLWAPTACLMSGIVVSLLVAGIFLLGGLGIDAIIEYKKKRKAHKKLKE